MFPKQNRMFHVEHQAWSECHIDLSNNLLIWMYDIKLSAWTKWLLENSGLNVWHQTFRSSVRLILLQTFWPCGGGASDQCHEDYLSNVACCVVSWRAPWSQLLSSAVWNNLGKYIHHSAPISWPILWLWLWGVYFQSQNCCLLPRYNCHCQWTLPGDARDLSPPS